MTVASFLLTWNPERWPWDERSLRRDVESTAAGRRVKGRWSVGGRRGGISPGDRAYLLRQQSERGLVASGVFASDVFWDRHWDGSGRQTTYAAVEWDVVVEADDRLPVEVLKARVAEVSWDRLQGSGVRVPARAEHLLGKLWVEHVSGMLFRSPEELETGHNYIEGGVTRVAVNRYERDRAARQACIHHWGTACAVCGFDFEATYGKLGRGFVHVHHLTELSTVGPGYKLDPVTELRPVCPNCHAMLHRSAPALTIGQLRRRLRRP